MAPSVAETVTTTVDQATNGVAKLNLKQDSNKSSTEDKGPLYPYYYPYFDVDEKFPPTELFGALNSTLPLSIHLILFAEHTDRGLKADPAKPNLLGSGVTTNDLSPYIGTEVTGVQISQLNEDGLNELALYAAQRKLLVFRDQDFKDIGPEKQIAIAK